MDPFHLFYDTETDGSGRQMLMQIAWVVTDAACTTLSSNSMYVKGAHNVTTYAPHAITTEYANEHGVSPTEAITLFMADVVLVTEAGGRVVAHNARFDMDRVNREIECHNIPIHPLFSWKASFCTMRDPRVRTYCALSRSNGGLKDPSLPELFQKLHGTFPTEQLHDALGDARVLRDCFSALLRAKILVFPPPAPVVPVYPRVCTPGTCNLLVDASDLAVIANMMTHEGKHSFQVVERVVARCAQDLQIHWSALETHPTMDPEHAEKAKALFLACNEPGVVEPPNVTEKAHASGLLGELTQINGTYTAPDPPRVANPEDVGALNAKVYYICGGVVVGRPTLTWGILGYVDGITEDEAVVAVRHGGAQGCPMSPTDRIQLEMYMRMSGKYGAVMVRKEGGAFRKIPTIPRDEEVADFAMRTAATFFQKLARLIHTPELWAHWASDNSSHHHQTVWESMV